AQDSDVLVWKADTRTMNPSVSQAIIDKAYEDDPASAYRPGIMLASAMRSYLNRFAVVPGRRIAIFTNTDDGWHTACDLAKVGIEVPAIIDSRTAVSPQLAAKPYHGTRTLTAAQVNPTKAR